MELFDHPLSLVFLYSLLTAVTTGLGAVPFFFIKEVSPAMLGKSNAVASGLMLAASFSLISEGYVFSSWMTLSGILAGLILVVAANYMMEGRADISVHDLIGAKRKKMLLFLGIMTIHSFAEGVSVGVSFASTLEFGIFIAIAIAVHNIPEGLAISLVMVPQGTSPLKAVWWSIFSSLPQPLMAIPAFLFVEVFEQYLPFGLGLAGGAMIWVVFSDLIPEALQEVDSKIVGIWVTIAILAMSAFQVLIGE